LSMNINKTHILFYLTLNKTVNYIKILFIVKRLFLK